MSAAPPPRNAVENAVFGIGLLLLVGLVALLVMEWVQWPDGGPRLSVSVGTPAGALVPVEVRNDGGAVAEAVRVEVCRGATCGETELPYVPAGATREAVVGADGEGAPRARIFGYLAP